MKHASYFLILLTFLLFLSSISFSQTLVLTPSTINGSNISCFGGSNGSIDLTISGGTSPYIILWSTGDTTQDLDSLPAGYYHVTVEDADTLTPAVEAEITLVEPRELSLELTAFKYPNNYNISLFGACNGSITAIASDGIAPYTWLWNDNITTANRSALCALPYTVLLLDANGCKIMKNFMLNQPEWIFRSNRPLLFALN